MATHTEDDYKALLDAALSDQALISKLETELLVANQRIAELNMQLRKLGDVAERVPDLEKAVDAEQMRVDQLRAANIQLQDEVNALKRGG